MRPQTGCCVLGLFALGLLLVLPAAEGYNSEERLSPNLNVLRPSIGATCPSLNPVFICNCTITDKNTKTGYTSGWGPSKFSGLGRYTNRRNVRQDFLTGGGININNPEAILLASNLPFRDPDILDNWDSLPIERVRVEVFNTNTRKTFFIFNGAGSDIKSWFTQSRLLSSAFADLRDPFPATDSFFSIDGDSRFGRTFLIQRLGNIGCNNDCGYLFVKEPNTVDPCDYDSLRNRPYFIYSNEATCGRFNRPAERDTDNRFLISVELCYH